MFSPQSKVKRLTVKRKIYFFLFNNTVISCLFVLTECNILINRVYKNYFSWKINGK